MRINELHRDERGSISIISVFAALLLTMLLGMVLNVGRQVDGKIRLQNAADAAAYSGGLELARGMNALAFTNHLLCEMFAMTAILREASDPQKFPQYNGQQAARHAIEILDAWSKAAQLLKQSTFGKYQKLGNDLEDESREGHLKQERELVWAFTAWAEDFSERYLQNFEDALKYELIPQYQRAAVAAFPAIAQAAAMEAARRNGEPDFGRGQMLAAFFRANGQLVGDPAYEAADRTLPVVDPLYDAMPDQAEYLEEAKEQRNHLAYIYLMQWNWQIFQGFDYLAPFSKFRELWAGTNYRNGITCAQLGKLLAEYPSTNLPFQIRKLDPPFDPTSPLVSSGTYNAQLEANYIFSCVAYWKKVPEFAPRIFSTPMPNDLIAYAEIHLFQPKRRLVWQWATIGGSSGGQGSWFGPLSPGTTTSSGVTFWQIARQDPGYFPTHWSLLDQNWACQLAPATQNSLEVILQNAPQTAEFGGVTMPTFGNLKTEDIRKISPH
jgi:hypothetical protein